MFKGAPFDGIREHHRRTVANETHERLEDSNDNSRPPENKMHLTCNSTTNSNSDLTIDILKQVMFPYLKIDELNRGGVLVDDFTGHSTDQVTDHVKKFQE